MATGDLLIGSRKRRSRSTTCTAARTADISWLSAFPGEKEVLFPPLTYLKPTGRAEVVGQCTVVEVTPTLA